VIHWLAHVLGIDNVSGPYYAAWSGFVGDVTVLGVFAVAYRRLVCHQRRCLRLAHHPVDGTPYRVCRKHHPDIPNKAPTAEEIAQSR
jgi:hypothetical protein